MKDASFKKLVVVRKATKNILAPETGGFDDGKVRLVVADETLRSMAQNLIDHVDDHRHLAGAGILILVKHAEATAKKLAAGEKIIAGTAKKANNEIKLLTEIFVDTEKNQEIDFVITLSGDWLDMLDADVIEEKSLALIDHEMMHCGAKVAIEFVPKDEVKSYVKSLGIRHIETCKDIVDEDEKILVRYYHTDGIGNYIYQMRKHDIEEFDGIVARHGRWNRELGRFGDVMVKHNDLPLLKQTG